MHRILAEPLEVAAFAPYGAVVSADRADVASHAANQGTAQRRDFLVELANRRPAARLNVASFRCAPWRGSCLRLTSLEKHPASSQLFVPMNARRYLVVVALGDEAPALHTLRAFVAPSTAAVAYHPGIWHHPMIALDQAIDFTCLVYEDGGAADCVVAPLVSPLEVVLDESV